MADKKYYKRNKEPIEVSEYGKLPPQANNNLYLCIAVQL